MYAPDYPVVTERLLLRPFIPADVDDLYAYQSREDVTRYIPYPPRTRETVAERTAPPHARSTIEHEGDALQLAVELSGTVIGDVVLFYRSEEHRTGEIGYVFNPDYGGHGYATEAARALLHMAFDGLGLHRVVARVDARNAPSIAVLRRLGMRQEAYLVQNEWSAKAGGEWTDEIDFATLDQEWAATPAPG